MGRWNCSTLLAACTCSLLTILAARLPTAHKIMKPILNDAPHGFATTRGHQIASKGSHTPPQLMHVNKKEGCMSLFHESDNLKIRYNGGG